VIRSPRPNTNRILLLDTRKAIGRVSERQDLSRLKVWIDEEFKDPENEAYKANALKALDNERSDLPASREIQVLAGMNASAELGISDVHALRAINVGNCERGYAIPYGTKVYHSPSCSEVEFEFVHYVVDRPGEGYSACTNCL